MKKVFVVDERFSVVQALYQWFLSKGCEVKAFSKPALLCEAMIESLPDIVVINADILCENGEPLSRFMKRKFQGEFLMILFSAMSGSFKKIGMKKLNAGLLPQGFIAF